ncbi:MAG: DUF1538 domain-containing protein [Candidatus Riflebacteria bacterium]|nr:DUF1538 domain-containing protein [Candidatus Riflebacteria bacterium]
MALLEFLKPLWETVKSVLPITMILLIIQLLILKRPIENVKGFVSGVCFAILGLHFFLKGTEQSLVPLATDMGASLLQKKQWIILLIGFAIGYGATLVEPGLKSLAMQIDETSGGTISPTVLINTVALGFGGAMAIGLWRILHGVKYVNVAIPLLALVIALSILTKEPFAALGLDCASATTGPVNIPINTALAVGLASSIAGMDPLLEGFGLVGLTSLGSMVSVMILGLFA